MDDAKPTPEEPKQPCACEGAEGAPKSSRRDFLLKLGLGLNVVAGSMIALPIAGYALSSFAGSYPLEWIPLGPVDKYPEGKTRLASFRNPYNRQWDGKTADIPCWVRRISGNDFQVFAINCTHLGCPVRWFEESKLFMCPCHGGAYYEDGGHAAGPPPRGLYTYKYKVDNNELFIEGGILPTLADPNI